MKLVIIGRGAIAQYVMHEAQQRAHSISAIIVRPEKCADGLIARVEDIPADVDLVIDCAGHAALRKFGPSVLRAGFDLLTVSVGALADRALEQDLRASAAQGSATLILASGAIGALDTLRSARAGDITSVRYVGRKPPQGWIGSPAEQSLDLGALDAAQTHFEGSARYAALRYTKNANVAAAVALAGIGFDDTQVTLIADPDVSENIHEIHASGAFGDFSFRINGKALPGNPRSSALAAMSVIGALDTLGAAIRF